MTSGHTNWKGRVLALAVCGLLAVTVGPACAQKGNPPWLLSPPADTPAHWYGVGEGPDADSARRLALRAVAARLRTAVSGSAENRIQDNDGRVSRSASVAVSEDVLKTEFSGVEVESTAPSPAGMAVLVKVDKAGFVRDTKTQLDVVAKTVAEVEGGLATQSSLEQFLALRRVGPQIDQALTLSQLLVGAGAVADGSPGITRFGGLQQRSKQIAAKMVFEVRAQPADADIAAALAGFLSEQGMRSATRKTPGANVLVIATQVRQDELFGDKLMKMAVRLSVLDEQGRDVANREHQVSGASRYDFAGARQAALKKLASVLRNEGPLSALGFSQ